jgi:hypothetical protein
MSGGPSATTHARKRALASAATASQLGSKAKRANPAGQAAAMLLSMEKKSWEDIADVAEHVADVAGLMYHGQITAAGTFNMQLGCPVEYAHDGVDVSIAGKTGMLYFRVYVVTPESMMRDELDDADGADGYGEWELGDGTVE